MDYSVNSVDLRDQLSSKANFFIINCASNSTLQDLKINESSGVFTYADSDDFTSVTSNRIIVWRTCDDVLELSEHSLNKNLLNHEIRIQFKNSLILQNGVSIHETPEKIYVLVTTLVSAHRLIFTHPNKLITNLNAAASSSTGFASDLIAHSIFHNIQVEDLDSVGNFVQLPSSTPQNTVLGVTSSVPYLATCSWVNYNLEAIFVISNQAASLLILKLPSIHQLAENHFTEVKTQTFDLKQNSLIGKLFNGFVPSILKSSNGLEAAVSILSFSTVEDDLIIALCRDLCIRVISLKRQECIIIHNLFQQQNPKDSPVPNGNNFNSVNPFRKPISMKLWWPENDSESSLPNLVVYISGQKLKSFFFFELLIPAPNTNSSFNINNISKPNEPSLRQLIEVFAPVDFDLIDYFVSNEQLWALWQHNDSINLEYYSISTESSNLNDYQCLEWVPYMADVNAPPEMSLRSALVNSREYYLNEIFWRGHFSLTTISKAISVLNRTSDGRYLSLKIDALLQEAIKLVDNIIRNQLENNLELTADEYTKLELDAWNQLYLFCLEYHINENKPLSIFVDYKTGVKGIVRKGKIEFIPSLSLFDDLISHYFLHCKLLSQQSSSVQNSNGDAHASHHMSLFSTTALEYCLNTLAAPIGLTIDTVFGSDLEKSILALLNEMANINSELHEVDLLNFEGFMNRMLNFSSQTKLSIADIAKMITEESLLPEMTPLSDVKFVDNFFGKCPLVSEAINFLLERLSFDFITNPNELYKNVASIESPFNNGEDVSLSIQDALEYEIKPKYATLLSSRCGLEYVASNISKLVQSRYKFCRDLFLIQFRILQFRVNLRSDYKPKIVSIETELIPQTAQLLFALDYLCWVSNTSMITTNIWWTSPNLEDYKGLTSIVNVTTSPSSNTGTTIKSNSIENSELLSVLELKDYINLNRVGILSHESTFYDAYPYANILHFFIQFSGGILAKRLLSFKLEFVSRKASQNHSNSYGIWSNIMSSYLTSVCQLLWPLSAGQFKLAEFLLGVGQYDLLERYVQRLNTWCMTFSSSRFFLKGICYLVSGNGQKAICQFNRAVFGINTDFFLHRIFSRKAKSNLISFVMNSSGDNQDEEEDEEDVEYEDDPRKSKNVNLPPRECVTDVEYSNLPNARTIFRYYNKLVQLFKRYSSPDNVIELVDFALNMLNQDTDPEFNEHYSSFHSTLFACYLRLGYIDQAYKAMVNNNDLDQKRICLRQFILNLCEKGDLNYLVNCPYSCLEDDFISILESKARATSTINNGLKTFAGSKMKQSDVTEVSYCINYYHILYTYFIKTNNYRRAAQSMYDYYRRLSHETSGCGNVELLQKQADSLLISRNCLKLAHPKYSWIIKNTVKRTDKANEENVSQRLKRKHDYFNAEQEDSYYKHQDRTIIDIVDDEELLCEYELVSARIKLLQRNSKEYAIAATNLTPDETVVLCITACFYEQAFRISSLFNLDTFEAIFSGMASKYVQLMHKARNHRRIDDELLLSMVEGEMVSPEKGLFKSQMNDVNCSLDLFDIFYENGSNTEKGAFISYSSLSICDRMWHLIMNYLSIYETKPKSSSNLMRQVAEKLLSSGIMIPTSLLKIYQKVNCSEVIRLLITYNFLPEATQLCIDYMNGFMGHGIEYFDISHHLYPNCPPLHIPLHIIDCLADVLEGEYESDKQDADNWQRRKDDITDADAVDSCSKLDKIDYHELHINLTKTKHKLQNIIISCSQ